jgi:cation:H+ antiporter
VAIDRAYKAILQRASTHETDLIVMGAQGCGSVELMLYGSNTQHVVRAAPCPLIALYFVSMRVIFTHEQHRRAREAQEVAEELQYADIPLRAAALHYGIAAVAVVGAALWLPRLGAELARQTGLGEEFVGSLFIAITTSLPEIAVSLAAVRLGAIDLGIGNVLGSNLFNLLILGLDDVFYRHDPLLAAVPPSHSVTIVAVVVMNGLFLVGLTYRVITKRFAVAWDTGAIAVVYVTAVSLAYVLRG